MIRDVLKKEIEKALGMLGLPVPAINLEHPTDLSHGDYSTNIAFVLFSNLAELTESRVPNQAKDGIHWAGKADNPGQLAEIISDQLNKKKHEYIFKTEASKGFINFYLTPKFFAISLKEILEQKDQFGTGAHAKGFKMMIEYTTPNPFKEFHIGHLMNNFIGESLSRVFAANGAEVKRATYHGDVGMHVAKTIYSLLKMKVEEPNVELFGRAYQEGNTAFETDPTAKAEIVKINKQIYEQSDATINRLYSLGREASFAYFEELYQRLGSKFDYHFYESEAAPIGKEVVLKHVGDVFEKSDGAVIFKGEKYGLHTRVFLNSEGLPTYEAKEVGLLELKRAKFPFAMSLSVTANEQDDFFRVMEKALGELYPEYVNTIKHVSHGVLKLPSGKMSSRAGTVVSAESLIDAVKDRVHVKIAERGFEEALADTIAEAVAQGAIRYSILKQAAGKDVVFDFDKSLSFEGDSGPYLQYAHTRAESIVHKAHEAGIEGVAGESIELNPVARLVYQLPEVVERAGAELAPHYIATYLIELASAFSSWYAKEKIIDPENVNVSAERVALTAAVGQVLKNGLTLLGIEAPAKM